MKHEPDKDTSCSNDDVTAAFDALGLSPGVFDMLCGQEDDFLTQFCHWLDQQAEE